MRIKVMAAIADPALAALIQEKGEFEQNKMEVLAWVKSQEDFSAQFTACHPRLLILEGAFFGMKTEDVIQDLRQEKDNYRVLVVADGTDAPLLTSLLRAGVSGFIPVPPEWKFPREDSLWRGQDTPPLETLPIEETLIDEFNQALVRLSAEIRHTTIRQIRRDAAIAMRSLYFWKLIASGSDNAQDFHFANHIMRVHFREGAFRILLFRFDHMDAPLPDFSGKDFFYNLTPMQQMVEKMVNDSIYEYCYEMMFDYRSDGVQAIINYDRKYEWDIQASFEEIRHTISDYTTSNYKVVVTLCVGGAYESFSKVRQSQDEAFRAAWYRMKVGTDRVIYWNEKHVMQSAYEQQIQEITERLKFSSDTLNFADFEKNIDELFQIPEYVLTNPKTQDYILEFVDYFFEINGPQLSRHINVEERKGSVAKTLFYSYTLDIYKQNLKEQFEDMYELLTEDIEKKNIRTLRKALKYIKENYNQQLTTEKLAQVVNLSPGYFSHLFKKQVGMNMTDYITDFRIKTAKKMLLETDQPVSDIARSVGFPEQRYFSKRFKQNTGMTPSEYRKLK